MATDVEINISDLQRLHCERVSNANVKTAPNKRQKGMRLLQNLLRELGFFIDHGLGAPRV